MTRRKYSLTLKVHADDTEAFNALLSSFLESVLNFDFHADTHLVIPAGGSNSAGFLEIAVDSEMTHDKYLEHLENALEPA